MNRFFKKESILPIEKNLHQLRNANIQEVIEFLEGPDIKDSNRDNNYQEQQENKLENHSIFDDFLLLLRKKGVRVSTPEWLQFLQVINVKIISQNLRKIVENNELLNKVRLFAQSTLVKDKSKEAAFHEAFDEYFESIAQIYNRDLKRTNDSKDNNNLDSRDSNTKPDIKEQLGIDKIAENLDFKTDSHSDNENIHGGKKDQHNDILQQKDLSKSGGGDKIKSKTDQKNKKQSENHKDELKKQSAKFKKQTELTKPSETTPPKNSPKNPLIGKGRGKYIISETVKQVPIAHPGKQFNKDDIKKIKKRVSKIDRRKKYDIRPDKASIKEVIRNLRRIITDISEIKSNNVHLKGSVKNFARRNFRFDYQKEQEKQSEVVLFIDVGGPVDEWSPLIKEVVEEMAKGLSKLEIYLFHNNLYGYVWKANSKDLLASSYPQPNSLIDLKKIIKKRKKIIIYGDAEMSDSEFKYDCWEPSDNNRRLSKFSMGGEESLKFIKKKANSVVWINPIFKKEWERRDDSGSIADIKNIIPMYDLTIGGVEDAIKKLMQKK